MIWRRGAKRSYFSVNYDGHSEKRIDKAGLLAWLPYEAPKRLDTKQYS